MPVPGFNRPGDGAGGLKIPDKLNFVANLNAKNQPSTMADPVATLISKVSNLGYVGSKRWASGTVTSSSGTQSFTVAGSTGTSPSNYVTVSGLTFKPTTIYLVYYNGTSTDYATIYSELGGLYPKSVKVAPFAGSGFSTSTFHYKGDVSPAYVNSSGFCLPVNASNVPFSWIAIE